ncbi:AlpA family phage regulatory protein [Janthinobacterium sp. FT14W]|uniref:helix-turn-helix transcriptional regulator n=1 Tax=Janthinobacterium sp. FT14W TaxID=2654253 RepID=UPI00126511FC|nr:AlpA family phage regulatory protein [Janthinobacterium sp. FT14W]KAB8057620.1 AlpA family phage regulatory protein [Janthinobacterium sp. FT14W]
MDYVFALKYRLPDDETDLDALAERLGSGGGDDALAGIGQAGRLALEFTREAGSASEALLSALADVKAIVPRARLVEAAPDFVGLTDVAQVLGLSRQNLHKLMNKHRHSFPAPVHEGSTTIWHLADVLAWLHAKGTYRLERSLIDVAQAARHINLAREAAQAPQLPADIAAMLA